MDAEAGDPPDATPGAARATEADNALPTRRNIITRCSPRKTSPAIRAELAGATALHRFKAQIDTLPTKQVEA